MVRMVWASLMGQGHDQEISMMTASHDTSPTLNTNRTLCCQVRSGEGTNWQHTHIFPGMWNGFAHSCWCILQLLGLELGTLSCLYLVPGLGDGARDRTDQSKTLIGVPLQLHVAFTVEWLYVSFLCDLALR